MSKQNLIRSLLKKYYDSQAVFFFHLHKGFANKIRFLFINNFEPNIIARILLTIDGEDMGRYWRVDLLTLLVQEETRQKNLTI